MKTMLPICILFIFNCFQLNTYSQVTQRDSLALVALYDSTDGANWNDNTKWLTGQVSTWYGITVIDSNVTRIEFSQNNLSGHLPPQIGDLDSLVYLRLFWNDSLTGEIPKEIGNLKKVETLQLNNNNFTGEIPKEIGNLENLERIILDQSDLTGAIPAEITNCLKLESFRARNNSLDSIPDLSGLPLLNDLWIDNNNFTGPLPEWFYSLSSMKSFNISFNQFTGELSPDIANIPLTHFYWNNNNLSGTIPKEIGTMNNVTFLQLNGNDFSGEIPPELGDMENLVHLRLHQNQLTGEIPKHLANLDGLETLNLGNNQLTGSIPDSIGYLTTLKWLYLSDNSLEGSIPQTFKYLVNLEDIYLSNNNFGGTLDSVFDNARNAERIYIYGNNFIGAVPDSFVTCQNLSELYIGSSQSGNNFSELPSFADNQTLNFFDIRNNSFTFEDIEPQLANTTLSGFNYSPQDSVGEVIDTTVAIGSNLTLEVMVGGTANEYQWMKNDVDIPGANNSSYSINPVSASDSGSYNCKITSTIITDLILYSQPVTVKTNGVIPVELSSFSATTLVGKVTLTWKTASETNNNGFEVQRNFGNSVWEKIGFVQGNGTISEVQKYEFIDDISSIRARTISYRLKQIDFNGSFEYSDIVEVEIAPSVFSLSQNFPNPFNPSTKIEFSIPVDSDVKLTIYNLLGQVIIELVNKEMRSGNYSVVWNGGDQNGLKVSSGVYVYKMLSNGTDGKEFQQIRKMVLMK